MAKMECTGRSTRLTIWVVVIWASRIAQVTASLKDGLPRPVAVDNKPSTSYGTIPAVTYKGQPTPCIWYGFKDLNYNDVDTTQCLKDAWGIISDPVASPPSKLQAYGYYWLQSYYDAKYKEYLCYIGCFDLGASSPSSSPSPPNSPPSSPPIPPPPSASTPPPTFLPPASSPSTSPPPNSTPPPLLASSPPSSTIQAPTPVGISPAPTTHALGTSDGHASPPTIFIRVDDHSQGQKSNILAATIGAIGALLAAAVAVLSVWATRRCLKRRSSVITLAKPLSFTSNTKELPVAFSFHGLRRFTYQELSLATNNFGPDELLGRGGFGSVYKGQLADTGAYVAVKMVSPEKFHKGGEREFMSEVSIISQVHHRNLVKLQGCCYEKSNMLLVYDHMANGSLDRLLVSKSRSQGHFDISTSLPWDVRFKIVKAVSSAISYLHEECGQCILHRDVKPSNILLDANFNAYLADFGLGRLFDHDRVAPTMTCGGTPGYMAPEISHTGRFTTKSDVYSFGILVLEVACGRRPIEPEFPVDELILLDWVWSAHEKEDLLSVVDPGLVLDYNQESEMRRLLQVGLLCCIVDPSQRINITSARNMLMGTHPIPALPESKPEVHYRPRRKTPIVQTTSSSTIRSTSAISATSDIISSSSQTESLTPLGPR